MQNIQVFRWNEEQVNSSLHDIMTSAYKSVAEEMKSRGVNMRTAAFAIAIDRVAEAERVRGGI